MPKKKKGNCAQTVRESVRIQIMQLLEQFHNSNKSEYTFEADLTNVERALVHSQCPKFGLKSRSQGKGEQRRVTVTINKKAKKKKADVKPKLTQLSFSEGTKEVLRDLFMRYPPGDEGEGKEMAGKLSVKNKNAHRKPDTMFRKPSMDKAEIGKKVESFAKRRETNANLRQISEDKSKLPITSYKDVIISAVESHQVVLISGETGCGKTTQVPQFILDHMWGKGEACKIVCTQPRRISAISVAERISSERGTNVGEDIGYKIRLESKGGRHSSIVFCTNGILLRMLVSRGAGRSKSDGSNNETKQDGYDITHIIMDEIHERDRHSDFMLAIMRDMLSSHPHLRLILMSATVNAERFSKYFGGCPIISVPGFTYPVKTFYLEDVLSILRSAENNHLNPAVGLRTDDPNLTKKDKLALDEAINLAWSSDEYDPLLELVSTKGSHKVYNYQHSITGLTPLMVFAGKGRTGDVCMLLSFGADCQLRAKDGTTALELAEQEDQLEVAEILKENIENALSDSLKEKLLLDKYLQYFNPENVDFVLIEQLLRKICSDSEDGAVLVFLPGWDDINKTRDRLLMNPYFRDSSKFLIISLHSMVPSGEQRKVFKRPPLGCRKIVLSTNMAETAVTIDDVVYVIDSGRMKEKNYDPYNNVSTLQSSWVSKANATQRRGRAGRCQAGICYHLYSKLRADSLPDFQEPEIKRMPIEELCLQVKLLDPDCKVEDFLSKTLDPPVSETIHNAIAVLQDIGALSLDEKLTELGEKLGSLPVHPLTSKMLFFAILMNCLDPALTLACAADYKDPFAMPMTPEEKKSAAGAKSDIASLYGGHSDQLALIAAFDCWKIAKERGQERQFCSQYFVSSSTMQMLSGMRKQLQTELIRHGFIPEDVSRCSLNARNPGILRAVLVAGLYPMVGRLLPPSKINKRSIVETASGAKVRLHTHSINFKLSFKINDGDRPLVVYDEITRGDAGMNIRNCTVVAPLPLLLLSTEIAVSPANNYGNISVAPANNDSNDNENDEGSDVDDNEHESGEDAMEIDSKPGGKHEEKIMSPDNSVIVIVDRWLDFESKALDVAQIYCLREHLSTAILFKVTHPKEVLPPGLGASVYAIACALSYDGLSGISLPHKFSEVDEYEFDDYVRKRGNRYLHKELLTDTTNDPHQYFLGPSVRHNAPSKSHNAHQSHQYVLRPHNIPHQHGTRLPANTGATRSSDSLSQSVHPPVDSANDQRSPSRVTRVPAANGAVRSSDPLSQSVRPPLDSADHQRPPSQGTSKAAANGAVRSSGPLSQSVRPPFDSANHQKPSSKGTSRPAANGAVRYPPSDSVKPPLKSASMTTQKTAPPSQGPNLVGYGAATYGPYGPTGGDSLKRKKRRNGAG